MDLSPHFLKTVEAISTWHLLKQGAGQMMKQN
jgi:hypothetical protein